MEQRYKFKVANLLVLELKYFFLHKRKWHRKKIGLTFRKSEKMKLCLYVSTLRMKISKKKKSFLLIKVNIN